MPRRPRQVARRGEVTSSLPFVLSLSKHGPSFRRSTKRTALRQAQGERSLVRFKTRSQMTLRMPAEWAPHDAVWIGLPHLSEEWSCAIDDGRHDAATFANAVPHCGPGGAVRGVVD